MAFNHSDYSICQVKLLQAGSDMYEATQSLETILEDYFHIYPQWLEMAEKTIRESRSRKTILVDKFAAKCHLYHHEKRIKSFDVELGINWIGDKRHQGDKATPEGQYKVIRKRKGADTNYYKALLLDYPNEQDHKRFEMEIKNGTLSDGTQIGGMIEIHGGGGRGMHWTDGCIALTDNEMDYLYDFASTNTPVTIVGSLVSFEELKRSILENENNIQ
jgi:murein L,D-transpeptidase YafK